MNLTRIQRTLGTIALVCLAPLAGCGDFLDVTNPGPVEDDALNRPEAMPALVHGMSSDLSYALSRLAYITALAAGEQSSSGSYLWTKAVAGGTMDIDEAPDVWGAMQRARWVAESGIERMQEVLGSDFESSPLAARAYLHAAFSNRMLGESVCQAVFDGGPPGDPLQHLERAEEQFNSALSIAESVGDAEAVNAALAGRASVRASLGRWGEAVADAEEVPIGFSYNALFSLNSGRENNYFVAESYNRLEATEYGTEWAQVFDDPRVPWDTLYDAGGSIRKGQDGSTPVFQQKKYPTFAEDIPLAKGTEMLLIRAEALHRDSDVPGAVGLINEERSYYGLGDTTASTPEEGWALLQKERGAVLWLEARRLWDLRRWHAEGLNDFLEGRDDCIPPSREEQAANPNF
jgi:hypothetical protein